MGRESRATLNIGHAGLTIRNPILDIPDVGNSRVSAPVIARILNDSALTSKASATPRLHQPVLEPLVETPCSFSALYTA